MMTNNDEANPIDQDLQTSQDNQTAISEATKTNLNAEEHRNLLRIWGCGEEFDSNNEFDDPDWGSGYSDDEIDPETGVLRSEYALYYENTCSNPGYMICSIDLFRSVRYHRISEYI